MDDKEAQLVILGGPKGESKSKDEDASSDYAEEGDMSEDEFEAAMDVKRAFKSGDDEDFALALYNYVCKVGA